MRAVLSTTQGDDHAGNTALVWRFCEEAQTAGQLHHLATPSTRRSSSPRGQRLDIGGSGWRLLLELRYRLTAFLLDGDEFLVGQLLDGHRVLVFVVTDCQHRRELVPLERPGARHLVGFGLKNPARGCQTGVRLPVHLAGAMVGTLPAFGQQRRSQRMPES
jgi:hypothetical protein